MNGLLYSAPFAERMDHLYSVVSSERFHKKQGLGNEVPFFVCPYPATEAVQIDTAIPQLVNRLSQSGTSVLQVNLYDLSIDILRREGDWDWLLENESTLTAAEKKDELQNILDVESIVVPEIAKRMSGAEFNVMFLTGIGEVFPFIRSHNVLNNLQRVAKDQPTILFFPGEYFHSLEKGASLDLFGKLRDDKYYRAFNIFDYQI